VLPNAGGPRTPIRSLGRSAKLRPPDWTEHSAGAWRNCPVPGKGRGAPGPTPAYQKLAWTSRSSGPQAETHFTGMRGPWSGWTSTPLVAASSSPRAEPARPALTRGSALQVLPACPAWLSASIASNSAFEFEP